MAEFRAPLVQSPYLLVAGQYDSALLKKNLGKHNLLPMPLLLPLVELALIPAPVCPGECALPVLPALSKIALIAALHTRCVSASRDGPHSARPPRPSLQALRCCTLISHTHLFPLGKAIEPCPCGSPSSKSPV